VIASGAAVRVVWSSGHPWDVRIIDVESGRNYTSEALEMDFHMDAGAKRWLDLLMMTDASGAMQTSGGPSVLTEDGRAYCKGVFRFEVTEMSVE
jgi:hypothetical protein